MNPEKDNIMIKISLCKQKQRKTTYRLYMYAPINEAVICPVLHAACYLRIIARSFVLKDLIIFTI